MSCTAQSKYSALNCGKQSESALWDSMLSVVTELDKHLSNSDNLKDFRLYIDTKISNDDIFDYLELRNAQYYKKYGIKYELIYARCYSENYICPDGGVIWLANSKTNEKYPIIISEMKTQGTNKGRKLDGKKAQAIGNAVERNGKYSMSFSTMYEYEDIFPFVTFVSGCDFDNSASSNVAKAKLISMNGGLSAFNKIYTSKNMPFVKSTKPYTIMVREQKWNIMDMRKILLEVAVDSLNYFINEVIMPSR